MKYEDWIERIKKGKDMQLAVRTETTMLNIQTLLSKLEDTAAENHENAPKLTLYCDLSYELHDAEDLGEIRHGQNVLAEYYDILTHYGRYSRRYQEFEQGEISQEELAKETHDPIGITHYGGTR